MAEETIGIGVKVDLGDAKRAFKDELPKLAKDTAKGWEAVSKAIESGGPSGLGEAGKLSLERHRRLASELAERASQRGHWFRNEKREYDTHYREVERLAKRHYAEQVRIAKDSLPAYRDAQKQYHTILGQWQKVGPAGRAALQPDLDRARTNFVNLSNEVEGPGERLRQTQQQLNELRETANLMDVKQRPRQTGGWMRSAARVGGRLLGFGTAAGVGYAIASRLRSGISDEMEREVQAADMGQRLREGMSQTAFEDLARGLPSLRPNDSTKFLATYGTLAGARNLPERAKQAVELTRAFGFAPEYGSQTFGQVSRLGIDQKAMAITMGETIAQAQMRGREGEVFDSVIRMTETLIQRVGKIDSIEPIASLMGRLGATGMPGLQGEYGARTVSGIDAAFRGTELFPMGDLRRPAIMSAFWKAGVTNPAEMMRRQEAGLLNDPKILKNLVEQVEQYGGVESPLGARLAQNLGFPLNTFNAFSKAVKDDSRTGAMGFTQHMLGLEGTRNIRLEDWPNIADLAVKFQGRAQQGESLEALRPEFRSRMATLVQEGDVARKYREAQATVAREFAEREARSLAASPLRTPEERVVV